MRISGAYTPCIAPLWRACALINLHIPPLIPYQAASALPITPLLLPRQSNKRRWVPAFAGTTDDDERCRNPGRWRGSANVRFPVVPACFKPEPSGVLGRPHCACRGRATKDTGFPLAGRVFACKRKPFRRQTACCLNSLLNPSRERQMVTSVAGIQAGGVVRQTSASLSFRHASSRNPVALPAAPTALAHAEQRKTPAPHPHGPNR